MNFGSPWFGNKISRSLIVAGVLTTSLFLTSCDTNEALDTSPSKPATVEATATESATPKASKNAATAPKTTAKATTAPATPTVAGERIETVKGVYIQKTLPENFAGYTVDTSLVPADMSASYTPEEIASAQKFIVDFMATEGVNSAMNNGGQSAEDWFAEHKNLIHPDFQEELSQNLSGDKYFVTREDWQNPEYNYVYGENETRLQNFTATPVEYLLSKSGAVGVRMQVQYFMKVDTKDPRWPELQESVGTIAYAVARDGKGGWSLTSYQSDLDTIHPEL